MKYTIPMAITFDASNPGAARKLAEELQAFLADGGVKFAIQGAAVRAGARDVKTLVGQPQQL